MEKTSIAGPFRRPFGKVLSKAQTKSTGLGAGIEVGGSPPPANRPTLSARLFTMPKASIRK